MPTPTFRHMHCTPKRDQRCAGKEPANAAHLDDWNGHGLEQLLQAWDGLLDGVWTSLALAFVALVNLVPAPMREAAWPRFSGLARGSARASLLQVPPAT